MPACTGPDWSDLDSLTLADRSVCMWRLWQLVPSTACVDDITRLLYCSMCSGRATTSSTPRCRGHCSNIVRACLSVHVDVNVAWNDYLRQSLASFCLSVCLNRVYIACYSTCPYNDIRNASSPPSFPAKLKTPFYCCIGLYSWWHMIYTHRRVLYWLLVNIIAPYYLFFTLHYITTHR